MERQRRGVPDKVELICPWNDLRKIIPVGSSRENTNLISYKYLKKQRICVCYLVRHTAGCVKTTGVAAFGGGSSSSLSLPKSPPRGGRALWERRREGSVIASDLQG